MVSTHSVGLYTSLIDDCYDWKLCFCFLHAVKLRSDSGSDCVFMCVCEGEVLMMLEFPLHIQSRKEAWKYGRTPVIQFSVCLSQWDQIHADQIARPLSVWCNSFMNSEIIRFFVLLL